MGWLDRLFPGERTRALREVPSPDVERTLVLYKYDSCGYCRLVLRVLERSPEVEVTYRDVLREQGARAELREKTGRTQVPCLFIDGVALFESSDIVTWLRQYASREG